MTQHETSIPKGAESNTRKQPRRSERRKHQSLPKTCDAPEGKTEKENRAHAYKDRQNEQKPLRKDRRTTMWRRLTPSKRTRNTDTPDLEKSSEQR